MSYVQPTCAVADCDRGADLYEHGAPMCARHAWDAVNRRHDVLVHRHSDCDNRCIVDGVCCYTSDEE